MCARRQRCSRNTRFRFVVSARCDRCDGPSRCGCRGGGQRRVPSGRHPTVGDRPRWPRRRARGGTDGLNRLGAPIPAVHARAHRRSARIADDADPGVVRGRARKGTTRARFRRRHRTQSTPLRRCGCALPRCHGRARSRVARRNRHRRRRRQHGCSRNPSPARSPGRPVRGRTRHGRHGLQLRRGYRNGLRSCGEQRA